MLKIVPVRFLQDWADAQTDTFKMFFFCLLTVNRSTDGVYIENGLELCPAWQNIISSSMHVVIWWWKFCRGESKQQEGQTSFSFCNFFKKISWNITAEEFGQQCLGFYPPPHFLISPPKTRKWGINNKNVDFLPGFFFLINEGSIAQCPISEHSPFNHPGMEGTGNGNI